MVPIALFTYKRVDTLTKTITALLQNYLASQTELYIYSDGPKDDIDVSKVNEVRNYIKKINGFKNIIIKENKENLGLANSVIYGVTEVINRHGKVIVVEDDLITSPNFLDFMNQSLSFYQNDKEIISISGFTLDLPSLPIKNDNYFGYRASSWGWGTWKSQWDKIDWGVSDYKQFINSIALQRKFNRGGSDMTKMLKFHHQGRIDSWAIRFCFHQFKYDMKTVFPSVSKVQNIGFSKEASHTTNVSKRFNTVLDDGKKRIFHFKQFEKMDEQLVKQFRDKFSIRARLIDKIFKINNY